MSSTAETFQKLAAAMFPYLAKEQKKTDAKLVEEMRKEAKKGVILFKPDIGRANPLVKRAKEMKMDPTALDKIRRKAT